MPQHTAVATLHTNHGDIVVNLFGDQAPKTVNNFIGLSDGSGQWTDPRTGKPGEGALYSDVIFHRIIPGFMIQGGDPLGQGVGGPGYTFDDEISPELNFNEPYKLAMANAGKRPNAITGKLSGTNGSQFFITTDPTPWLQGKHTIFGEVADQASKAVVDSIAAVETGAQDRPREDVVLHSVEIASV
ncbi:peptidylprolyl isomerase [Microbacterium stercoris]|uniref:Peptidyl-prolyl cis-trans isomerase n=1 Tax=Microbacterium stercoris TaxID=2820289 RepID=A0A939QH65_9MICO|nr:peptidylprolyl isomerase [Microbacterium stercoris]MBO3661970.1 peptidylprolyl isomerase [Microbacterium stercoris]